MLRFRCSLWLIEIFSILVPESRRVEWKDEWTGELWYYGVELRRPVLFRCSGALMQALWLRKQEWRFEMLVQDLLYALRTLRRQVAFTVIAIVVLALGIGANTAIFSVVNAVLLRPAPFENIDRLVVAWETDRNSSTTREPASVPDYLDFQTQSRSFEQLAALMGGEMNLSPVVGEPVRLAALQVTPELLPMVGINTIAGRGFTSEENRAGAPRVALISESLWVRSFRRDSSVIGETLRLNERPHTIVGVVPDAADFGILQVLSAADYSRSFADRGDRTRVDVWTPLLRDAANLPRDTHPIFMLGKLLEGVSRAAAQNEMAAIAAELERAHDANDGRGVFIEPVADVVFGPVRPALLVLLGAVALVLLVACVNVANLILARGAARGREVAVRSAMGAGTGRLARQFLTENVVLTLLAGSAGVVLAFAAIQVLLAAAPADIPRLSEVTIDLRVLGMTLLVSIAAGLVFGMVPTLQARRVDLNSALKGGGARDSSASSSRGRVRAALVVTELALAVMLTIGAALLIKSFWRLQQVDPGFRAEGVLKAEYQLPPGRYPADFRVFPNFKEMHAFTNALLARVAALPGVEAAAIAGNHPLDAGFTNSFSIEGRATEAREWPEISIRRVTAGYFKTVDLALVRGRPIQDSDGTSAPPVALLNEAAARRFFGGLDPLGAKIVFWGAPRTIVGVVANEKFHGIADAPPIAVYLPLSQAPSANGAGTLLLRGTPGRLHDVSAVRGAFREIDPSLPIYGVEPLDVTLSRSVSQRKFTTLLLALFAGIALILSIVGVHGVLSYTVTQRTREIGIRMALGAEKKSVVRLVIREGVLLIALGLSIGLAGAFALNGVLSSLVFEITPVDPLSYAAVCVCLSIVALLACYIPARRAARMDPMMALRSE